MTLEILTSFKPGAFYTLPKVSKVTEILLPTIPVEDGYKLELVPHPNSDIGFGTFEILTAQLQTTSGLQMTAGYVFRSRLPVMNYNLGILSYSGSWLQTAAKNEHPVDIKATEVVRLFKSDLFLVFEVPTIATMVTLCELDDNLHNFLTMI